MMIEIGTFRLPLRHAALALCSVAIVALATPASARPSHGAGRHAHAHSHHVRHHVTRHHGRHYRHVRRLRAPHMLVDDFSPVEVTRQFSRAMLC